MCLSDNVEKLLLVLFYYIKQNHCFNIDSVTSTMLLESIVATVERFFTNIRKEDQDAWLSAIKRKL